MQNGFLNTFSLSHIDSQFHFGIFFLPRFYLFMDCDALFMTLLLLTQFGKDRELLRENYFLCN